MRFWPHPLSLGKSHITSTSMSCKIVELWRYCAYPEAKKWRENREIQSFFTLVLLRKWRRGWRRLAQGVVEQCNSAICGPASHAIRANYLLLLIHNIMITNRKCFCTFTQHVRERTGKLLIQNSLITPGDLSYLFTVREGIKVYSRSPCR